MSYILRKRRVAALDGGVVVDITIEVGVHDKHLTRDEHEAVLAGLIDKAMLAIAGSCYIHVPISKVKVTRS